MQGDRDGSTTSSDEGDRRTRPAVEKFKAKTRKGGKDTATSLRSGPTTTGKYETTRSNGQKL